MAERFTIEFFNRSQHDRTRFFCGVSALDRYIKQQVSSDIRRNLARCYVAIAGQDAISRHPIAGYYTLAAHSIETELLPEELIKCPYPAVPAVLIGRLAVCRSFQGRELGAQLVISALRKSIELHDELGIQVVVVDPLGEDVVPFYEKFGFLEFGEGRLLLPIKTAKQALQRPLKIHDRAR